MSSLRILIESGLSRAFKAARWNSPLFGIDGESLVVWNAPVHVARHLFQLIVQPGEILVRVEWQFEICVVFNAFRCPERARDEILLEIRPSSRMGHSDIARFQPLIESGQQGRFIMWPGEGDLAFCTFEDNVPDPAAREEIEWRSGKRFRFITGVQIFQEDDRAPERRIFRELERRLRQ